MPYPTDEMRAEMLRLNIRPTDAHDAPAPETWREVDGEGLCTENYVTFYHDATEPHFEGDLSFAKRILALLGQVCVTKDDAVTLSSILTDAIEDADMEWETANAEGAWEAASGWSETITNLKRIKTNLLAALNPTKED